MIACVVDCPASPVREDMGWLPIQFIGGESGCCGVVQWQKQVIRVMREFGLPPSLICPWVGIAVCTVFNTL